ncbi:MAG: M28 family peptidase [Planctomycetes bacterium]|nr:M28 family peptidase [Planctomycetota bacterium]
MKFLVSAVAIIALGLGIMFWISREELPTLPSSDNEPDINANEIQDGQFGIDRVGKGADFKPVPFDGKRAVGYLEKICALGPRISGSKGMRQQQEIIKKHFEDLGATVTYQTFKAKQNSVRGEVEMTNIIVSFQPEKKRRVILCSHYDTRPIADQEPDPRNWRKPFVSANDGGSGVALLMEMGNHMKNLKTNVGVDFVIFDGEEYVFVTEGGRRDRYFIGSEHFARTWRQTKNRCDYSAAILLDMIAGHDPKFPVEVNSYRFGQKLCEEIYGIARDLKIKSFQWRRGHEVQDDHLALQRVGIDAIDIIDFDYPHWHRLTDTPANCSAASFIQVANVLSVWLQRTK